MPEEQTIKPALTAEEWAKVEAFTDHGSHPQLLRDGLNPERAPGWFRDVAERHEANPHVRAALALHGQPFGFTCEDVERLRGWRIDPATGERIYRDETSAPDWYEFIESVAGRIAALLPPREGFSPETGQSRATAEEGEGS